jgi:hypothetical protein
MTVHMDKPFTWPGNTGVWCHLWSDLPGQAGQVELAEVAKRLKLKRSWLQHEGTASEHYDLCKGAIERARKLGVAEDTTRDFVQVRQAKVLAGDRRQ